MKSLFMNTFLLSNLRFNKIIMSIFQPLKLKPILNSYCRLSYIPAFEKPKG